VFFTHDADLKSETDLIESVISGSVINLSLVGGQDYGGQDYMVSIPLNTWFHFAWTLRGTLESVYINGSLIENRTIAKSPQEIQRPYCYIGHSYDLNPGTGGYDDIKIFSRALSASEVLADFNMPAYE
jgi:hypothetical protein